MSSAESIVPCTNAEADSEHVIMPLHGRTPVGVCSKDGTGFKNVQRQVIACLDTQASE